MTETKRFMKMAEIVEELSQFWSNWEKIKIDGSLKVRCGVANEAILRQKEYANTPFWKRREYHKIIRDFWVSELFHYISVELPISKKLKNLFPNTENKTRYKQYRDFGLRDKAARFVNELSGIYH